MSDELGASRSGPRRTISVELFHAYGLWSSDFEQIAESAGTRGQGSDTAVKEAVRQVASRSARLSVDWLGWFLEQSPYQATTCILLDDYFRMPGVALDRLDPRLVASILDEEFTNAGMPVDFIVSEAGLVAGVRSLLDLIVPAPELGAGSLGWEPNPENADQSLWLSNLEAAAPVNRRQRSARMTNPSDVDQASEARIDLGRLDSSRQHALRLEVEVATSANGDRGQRPFSCALLATWWQLLRLGIGGDLAQSEEFRGALLVRNGDKPFRADSTLSLLPTDVLEVEAAVRLIIQHIASAPREWLGVVNAQVDTFADEVLRRIAYMFVDDESSSF